MAGTILVCVYAALFFFPCSLRVALFFLFLFCFFLWFSGLVLLISFSHRVLFLWVFCFVFALVLLLSFGPFSRFSSPFYRDSQAASFNQSCLCRTVICHERDRGRETSSTIGSNPLQIFSLLNRDGEDEHDCSTSNGNVSAAMDIFILTPERF